MSRLAFVSTVLLASTATADTFKKPQRNVVAPPAANATQAGDRPVQKDPPSKTVAKVNLKVEPLPIIDVKPVVVGGRPGKMPARRTVAPNLSQTAEASSQPAIGTSGNDVYVVWTEGTGRGTILIARSPDAGATFDSAVNLSGNTNTAHHAKVVAFPQGFHAVWIEDTAAGARLYGSSSTDRGITFSPPKELSRLTITDPEVALAMAGSDPFVAYAATSNGTPVIQLLNLATGATTDLDKGRPLRAPALATRGKKLAASWQYDALGDWDIMVMASEDNGRTFRGPTTTNRQNKLLSIMSNYGDEGPAAIAYDDRGGLAFVHQQKNTLKRIHHVLGDYAASTEDLVLRRGETYAITALPRVYTYPANDSTFDYDRRPHVACAGSRCLGIAPTAIMLGNGTVEAGVRVWDWDPSTPSNEVGRLGRQARIAVTSDSYLAAFVTGPDQTGEVVATRKVGGAFASYALSANAGNSFAPEIAVAGSNYVVIWTDTTPGNSEIFFRAIPVK